MSSLLLFVMVSALFIHTFLNFFLKIWSLIVAKVSSVDGYAVPAVEHSIEVFVSKIVASILSWFKQL